MRLRTLSRAPGAGEAQRSATRHMRGATTDEGVDGRAAPDLKAVGGQLLTLTGQGAHLLGGHCPWGPGTIHQLPLQRFVKPHLWPQQQPLRLGWPVLWGSSRAPSFHLIPPTAHQGQGRVQPGQPKEETELPATTPTRALPVTSPSHLARAEARCQPTSTTPCWEEQLQRGLQVRGRRDSGLLEGI